MVVRPPKSLFEFVERLRKAGEIAEIQVPVDPVLELAEIHRRVILRSGPALLFHNERGAGSLSPQTSSPPKGASK